MKKHVIYIAFLLAHFLVSCQQKNDQKEVQTASKDLIQPLIKEGNVLLNSGQYDKAVKVFQDAVKIDSLNIDALYGIGVAQAIICNTNEEQCQEAVSNLSKVIRQDSKYRNSLYNRGTCYFVLGDLQKALNDLNSAVKLNPKDADYYYNRGLIHAELSDFKNACGDFRKSQKLGLEDAKEMIQSYCN